MSLARSRGGAATAVDRANSHTTLAPRCTRRGFTLPSDHDLWWKGARLSGLGLNIVSASRARVDDDAEGIASFVGDHQIRLSVAVEVGGRHVCGSRAGRDRLRDAFEAAGSVAE